MIRDMQTVLECVIGSSSTNQRPSIHTPRRLALLIVHLVYPGSAEKREKPAKVVMVGLQQHMLLVVRMKFYLDLNIALLPSYLVSCFVPFRFTFCSLSRTFVSFLRAPPYPSTSFSVSVPRCIRVRHNNPSLALSIFLCSNAF